MKKKMMRNNLIQKKTKEIKRRTIYQTKKTLTKKKTKKRKAPKLQRKVKNNLKMDINHRLIQNTTNKGNGMIQLKQKFR